MSRTPTQLLRRHQLSVRHPTITLSNTRTFLTSSITPALNLSATRTLPYSASALFPLIADVASYPSFVPFCTSADIRTHAASSTSSTTRYPAVAELSVGLPSRGLAESFTSLVFCAPNSSVEALCGASAGPPSIPAEELAHYSREQLGARPADSGLVNSLRTRWTLREEVGSDHGEGVKSRLRTDVLLSIEVKWKSPIYAMMSQALAPTVADRIVRAFEERARTVLGEGQ